MFMKRLSGARSRRLTKPTASVLAMSLIAGSMVGSAQAAGVIDPEADQTLLSMSTYPSGLSAFSVEADSDNEIVDLAGAKLQYSSMVLTMQRPGKLHVTGQGPFAESRIVFDG